MTQKTDSLRTVRIGAFLAVFTILLCVPMWAQFTSSVQGTVTDQTGSVVPDVKISLVNLATSVTLETPSNGSGIFRFPDLAPGRYRIRATKVGFQTVVQENIVLESGRIQGVPIVMAVGAITQEVTVTEIAAPIETSNPKISTTVTNEYVQNIPLALRNVYNVMQLAPGVTGFGPNGDSFAAIAGANATANGMRMLSNGYYVDGAPVNDMADGGGAKLLPNPDSVEEVRVSTNDYSAQWGKNAGILTQVVSKSGSNDLHGTLFWFHRDNKLTSRTFLQSTINPLTGRAFPVYRRNDFGGSVGGPVRKEKTFFFATVNKLKSANSFANLQTLETPEFVDFMRQRFPNNVSTKLLTTYKPYAGVSAFQAGSIQTVANLQPGCAGTNSLGMPCSMPVRGNAVYSDANGHDGLQWNARLDQYLNGSKDRIYANIYRTTVLNDAKNVRPAFTTAGITEDGGPLTSLYISGNYTRVFSPTLINEFSGSIVREVSGTPCNTCGVPSITITGQQGFGNGWAPGVFITRDINWQDVVSINRGKHSFKAGMTYFVDQEPLQFTAPLERPGFSFLNVFDFAADNPISESNINFDPRTGDTKIDNERNFRLPYYGFFFLDDWKAKSNLTINFGLRYEFNTNPIDKADKLANITLGQGSTMSERIAKMTIGPVDGLFRDGVPKHYFAPRLGIAWDPTGTGKMSVRSGFGIFYDSFLTKSTFDRMQLNPPNFAAGSVRSDDPTGPKPIFKLGTSDTRPYGFTLPGVQKGLNAAGGPAGIRAQVAGTPGTAQLPYTVNWFWGVQYSVTPKWTLEADYLGSRGIHLWNITDRNRCAGCGVARLNPFFAILEYHDNAGDSIYHGGTFIVKRRFDRGLSADVTYSIGKTIDVTSGGGGIGGATAQVFDAYNLRAQRGLSQNDYPQRLSSSFVWDLPIPKMSNAIANGIIGGWQTSGIMVFQKGRPYTVFTTGRDNNNDASFLDLPNVPTRVFPEWSRSDYIAGTFVAADFPNPATGQQGNLGRNVYRGPGFAQVDFSLIKNTQIPWFTPEKARFQLRIETFNILNRVNINAWETNLTAGAFGKATSARDPRTFQVGLRIAF